MDDDDYQRIADYESEIYGLNNQQSDDEEQDESVSDQQSSSGSDLEETNSPSSLPNDIVKDTTANGESENILPRVEYTVEDENGDSSDLSEDERDEIYARLYHGNTTNATSSKPVLDKEETKSASKTKKSKSKEQNGTNHFSNEFSFDIDLDDLPPPPEPPSFIPEVSTLDSDGDFPVPLPLPPFHSLTQSRPAVAAATSVPSNQTAHPPVQ